MSKIEQSWYQGLSVITVLLLPLSLVFWLISTVRRAAYEIGFCKAYMSPVPVIVVGNISVGGNGKTPFVIWLVSHLQQHNLKVGVISRGYGGHSKDYPLTVTESTSPADAGDEPVLIQRRLACPVVVGPNREANIKQLLSEHQLDVIVSDDGMQHYKMARAIECCIVDSQRRFGNGFIMPAGPLRETQARLNSVDLVIENGGDNPFNYQLKSAELLTVANATAAQTTLLEGHAVSAIGNPQRFENSLREQGISLLSCHHYRDHYAYSSADFEKFNDEIVFMTEKDAVKCQLFAKPTWYFLPVDAQPSAAVVTKLDLLLKEKGILDGL
ncbi:MULTISPECIES: tetraacyldisaccharide 4'-kinase [Pseudoalteromonas]|uniref:Tetraacyldisaccharide 4'-kinase n=1 Tax=Pseudoalteromonas haloplanktis TaxID=228 RepID=A0ABU1B8X7_PSEHA|nr:MULTISPECIES: tetraacyldisaccharide 4'-kinase [Pseudoalteromonas]MCF6142821.1 tetraacyldisaccharide 4'-kinase [Pseudoalteromonas mariniglutinosa NCIMB 1770]MDQ9090800.1 tetraacyldisaccharide 4'-kinase [Pseudoalteromonas haloplanktis]TMN70835.1 tetraacyldisaccharide 4'-kinase [Pseudoalteromonas sp. S1727]BDF94431.1 tetraacyldisaccharide 4'-kinase [Pseudoalteromonas sp. KAN5]